MNEFYSFINERKIEIKFSGENLVSVNNENQNYSLQKIDSDKYSILYKNKNFNCRVLEKGTNYFKILVNNHIYLIDCKTKIELMSEEILSAKNADKSKNVIVYAPMPGLVLKLLRKNGEIVKKNEPILILEAMKMENEILSPSDGKLILSEIKEGETIEKNNKLFEINNLLL